MNRFETLKPKEKLFYLQEVIHSCGLSPNEIAVYTTLIIFVNNKSGKCYPSRKAIGDRVNLSVRTVSRVISDLKRKGLIDVKSGTNGKSNEYLFLHHSKISSVLCVDDISDSGNEYLESRGCQGEGDKFNMNLGNVCPTYKDNKDNIYKDKFQIEPLTEEMQDYYDTMFESIIN